MKKMIKTAILMLAAALVNGCDNNPKFEIRDPNHISRQISAELVLRRGENLARIAGCTDCHSPKENTVRGPVEIEMLMFSGYPSDRPVMPAGPVLVREGWILFNYDLTMAIGFWGISFASNLTPDPTGIGNWTEDDFRLALKKGIYKGIKGNRAMLPPMPWENYANMTEDDINAIFTYFKNLQPVNNIVPQPFLIRNSVDSAKY